MGLVSFPSTCSAKSIFSNPTPFIISQANNSHINCSHNKNLKKPVNVLGNKSHHSSFPVQPSVETSFSASRDTGGTVPLLLPLSATSSESGEGDRRALEAVLKFYSAIKKRNISELSDIIGDECRCFCNFISFFQPFQGKQQVLEFISDLIGFLGNNIEFVCTPTLHDGMNVGVQWRLEWNNTGVPLGKGFSFHMCHVYHGKVVIKNVEMLMEPLLHIEPPRLKLMAFLMTVMDKLYFYTVFKSKQKRKRILHTLLLSLLFLVALSLIY